jgi:hypothetical protein
MHRLLIYIALLLFAGITGQSNTYAQSPAAGTTTAPAQAAQPSAQENAKPDPTLPPVSYAPLKNGIVVVGPPKVYDDLYLKSLLSSLQLQLAAIHGVDQATLLSHIGVVQGADTRQTSVALSGSGPATPQTSTFSLAPGVPAFSYPPGYSGPPDSGVALPTGTATATTPGTTTTTSSLTPTAPTPQSPVLTSPSISSLGQSSLDTYNESLQLSTAINQTALLLNGAVSDSLQLDGKPKTTVTIGFPVTVNTPSKSDRKLAGAVAEIRVSVCSAESANSAEPPSIVTLLPQERTYNVASLVDKSFLGSASAVVGGVINVGGGFLWSHQRYYLVQQQETVAFLDSPATSPCEKAKSAAFAWQVRPVLGKEFIRPGNSVNFVQISIPNVIADGAATKQIGVACVSIVWRTPSTSGVWPFRKTSDQYLSDSDSAGPACYRIEYYRTLASDLTLSVTDIGQGAVNVKTSGTFLPGTTVRLGNTYLNPDTITATHEGLTFTAPAAAIAAVGQVFIAGRDGREVEALNHLDKTPETRLTIQDPVISPYSDSQSLVTINFQAPDEKTPGVKGPAFKNPAVDPWVVVIGGKVFGLSDAPFFSFSGEKSQAELIVPTALLQSSPRIEMRRLLWPDVLYRASKDIPANTFSKAAPAIAKVSTLSSANGLTLAISGTDMKRLKLVFPDPACAGCSAKALSSTYMQVILKKPADPKKASGNATAAAQDTKDAPPDPTDGLRQLAFCTKTADDKCDENYQTLIVDVPKLDAPTPKPSLDKIDPIAASAKPITINITGVLLDQVVLIEHGKLPLNFRLVPGKTPSLAIDLPIDIASIPGAYSLLVTFADKSTNTVLLTIKKQGT